MSENNLRDTKDDFELLEVIYSSDRDTTILYDLVNMVTDFEIFEHIDKPFITAQIALLDTTNFVQNVDLQGGEKIRISIQSKETEADNDSITKNFIIDKVIKSQRADEKTEVFYIHCFEDIAFKSSLININKFYNDTPTNIIQNIVSEYMGRNLISSLDQYQTNMQVIVPNMHPIEAASWIKNRITSVDGLPYYFYSTFANDDLYLVDLGQLLTRSPINRKAPFTYIKSMAQQFKTDNFIPILSYKHENIDDVLTLIRRGYVGASYNFLNTLTGQNVNCNFDVKEDVFDQLDEHAMFKEQKRYNFGSGEKVNDIPLSSHNSEIITHISGNGSYNNGNYNVRTIDEELDPTAYKKRISSSALRHFMTKAPITVQVQGRPFIRGTGDYSIGNVARLLFLDSNRRTDETAEPDYKKSGDYLMYAARHSFSVRTPNRLTTSVLCARLSMHHDNLSVGDFVNV